MKIFSVHHKAVDPSVILSEGLETRFVKEGIAWTALLLSPLWLIFHHMWLVLMGAVVLYGLAAVAAETAGLGPMLSLTAVFVVNLIVALEGNGLRRWTLERGGYKEIGVVAGKSLEHCERRFFESLLDPHKKLPHRSDLNRPGSGVHSALAALRPSMSQNDSVVGLFPEPDPKS